jgi:phytoene desaturase
MAMKLSLKLLEAKYLSEIHRKMYSVNGDAPINNSFQVWAGIAADLSGESESLGIELPEPVNLGGNTYKRIWFKNYCFDKTMAPHGHSIVTSFFLANNFDWWEKLYADKEVYKNEKKRIATVVKEAIETRFPAALGKIEQLDVATPMTYVRYCNAWRGAWMSWVVTPRLKVRFMPMKLKGLSNFIMTGQWVMPPGGLPTAAITGRWAIQHLCADDNKPFIS